MFCEEPPLEISAEQKRVASPDALAGEIPNPKRIQTDGDQASIVDVDSDSDSDSASTLPQVVKNKPVVLSAWTSGNPQNFMIEELVDSPSFDDLTTEVLKDGEITRILKEFLETLVDNSPHTLRTRALEHYDQAKKIWGNHRFIDVLVKHNLPCSMRRYNLVASRKLSEFLMHKIRSDPSFEDIYKYKEPDSMMRSALSIWIGYWSNENMTLLLVDSMGRRALGLNNCVDDFEDMVNEEKTHLVSYPIVEEDMSAEEDMMVCSSFIADLRQDESIKTLAGQLLKNPEAVKMAEELIMSLQDDVPDGRADRYVLIVRHKNAVFRFWNDPVIVVQLRKALNESIHLVNILKKYSKRAQLLRCAERVSRIQRDPLLINILKSDLVHNKTRGALCILFAYWGEIDLTMLLCTIIGAQEKNEAVFEFDAKEDKVEVLNYLTVGPGDVKGLKNVLSDKYRKGSVEYIDRLLKIRAYQEEESNQQRGESEDDNMRFVTVLLKNGDVTYFSMET
ncbi:hypothetical protein CASFOL_025761 [Castilleja foliolosa]|uniref:Uncharacterized protein n=1 Tax=Castilleja foliolosa TaxID=1961234 RepID=A0ABD3CW21_9LAMI